MPRGMLEEAKKGSGGVLSARELEILLLAARGLSNREIGERTCTSQRRRSGAPSPTPTPRWRCHLEQIFEADVLDLRKSTFPEAEAGPTDVPSSQRSSLPRRSSMRPRRSSMRAKCSLILCLNSCSGIASPGSPGSPGRSPKPPPRSRSCRSRPRPPRPCPPPRACLSLSLPTWPSSFFSTSLASISLGRVGTRKRPKVGSDKSTPVV
jgi:hypothetical protein